MADPLSIAASIAGLTTFAAQLSRLILKYRSSFKDQASELESTKKKIEDLRRVLVDLDEQFAELECDSSQPLNATALARVESLVKGCSEHKNTLENRLAEIFGNDVTESAQRRPGINRGIDATLAGVRDTFRRFTYPIRREKLMGISSEIDQIFTKTSLALQLLMRRREARVESKIDDIQATIDQMKNLQVGIEDMQKISKFREWLKAPEPSEDYQRLASQAHPSTGSWLIDSDAFKSWKADDNSFIWLRGFAGCGKSVLCATSITHLLDVRNSAPLEVGVAYFFFTFADDAKQDASAMLRSLVLQLSQQIQDYSLLSHLHKECNDRPPTNDKLKGCLKSLIEKYKRVFIAIDALDESPRHSNRDEVLETLLDIRNWLVEDLHILVTSRDEEDIRYALDFSDHACDKFSDTVIPMQNESVDEDIGRYIREKLAKASYLRKLRPYHAEIEDFLSSRSNGVFRWVEFQLLALKSCPRSQHHVSKFLESLPPTLDATYERILTGIDETVHEDSKRLLSILCCAVQPMNVEELLDALAVDIGPEPGFNERRRLCNEDDLRTICPGMVEVYFGHWGHSQRLVRLAHFSVREYLVSDRIKQHAASDFHVNIHKAHGDVARVCLHYLMDPSIIKPINSSVLNSSRQDEQSDILSGSFDTDMQSGISIGLFDTEITDDRASDAPLATYAANSWAEHYRKAADEDQAGQLCDLVVRFFQWLPAFHTWRGLLSHDVLTIDFKRETGIKLGGDGGSPLYYTAGLGLFPVLNSVLGSGSNRGQLEPRPQSLINQSGGSYGYPLHAAARGGHREVVRLLLEDGARVNAIPRSINGTALACAIKSGDTKIIELLIENGADINAHVPFFGTALMVSSHSGHIKAMQLLLDSGADVNMCGQTYGTALIAASCSGSVEAVQLLLDSGADVNICAEGIYRTALIAASCYGPVEVIRLLLDSGAEVNMCAGQTYGTALIAASCHRSVEAIQLLLDSGADVNMCAEGNCSTALIAASFRGSVEAIRLLLDSGASVNMCAGRSYGTALIAASCSGSVEAMQLLLDSGADVNMCAEGDYSTALIAASCHGLVEAVRLLLDSGAGVNMCAGRSYGTALIAVAAGRRNIDTLMMLLEAGADATARSPTSVTALMALVKGGPGPLPFQEVADAERIRFGMALLEKGADINARMGSGETALELAEKCGDFVFKEWLLDHGAVPTPCPISDIDGL